MSRVKSKFGANFACLIYKIRLKNARLNLTSQHRGKAGSLRLGARIYRGLKRLIHHHPDDDDHRDSRHFVVSAKEHAALVTAFLAQLHHIAAKIQVKRRKDDDDGELDVYVADA